MSAFTQCTLTAINIHVAMNNCIGKTMTTVTMVTKPTRACASLQVITKLVAWHNYTNYVPPGYGRSLQSVVLVFGTQKQRALALGKRRDWSAGRHGRRRSRHFGYCRLQEVRPTLTLSFHHPMNRPQVV